MVKKIFGGILLCCILVPVSITLSVIDGLGLILACCATGIRMISEPIAKCVLELIINKPNDTVTKIKMPETVTNVLEIQD